jgi:hypothetical protein
VDYGVPLACLGWLWQVQIFDAKLLFRHWESGLGVGDTARQHAILLSLSLLLSPDGPRHLGRNSPKGRIRRHADSAKVGSAACGDGAFYKTKNGLKVTRVRREACCGLMRRVESTAGETEISNATLDDLNPA